MSNTGPWQSETGKPYLTKKGYQALNSYAQRQDIFRTFCFMQFYQEELADLKINDVVIGPSFNQKENKDNFFQLNSEGKFINIHYNDIVKYGNKKVIRTDLRIYDGSWFSWRGTLYFASSNLCNIEKLSIYYTKEGLNYLLTKRENYLFLLNNPDIFGPNQIKAFTKIPSKADWW